MERLDKMSRFAIILTHNRPQLLAQCIQAIGPQVDMIIVIDNASDPPAEVATEEESWHIVMLRVPDQPPNVSRMWQLGIDEALSTFKAVERLEGREKPYVAVLCDDTVVPPGWFAAVTGAMATTGAVVGCSNPWGDIHEPRLKTQPDGLIMERMPGWAWVLDLDSPVRPDESFPWWFGDTDIDWQARLAGGMVMIGGYAVPNIHPNENSLRPELAQQCGTDGVTFAAKYGWRPW
jgi:glycosyltransferase involved in cell wall biosynthesis